MGPYIVTKDELPLPENVNIVTKVNNEIRQDGNTGEMILKIDELIEEISKYVALHPRYYCNWYTSRRWCRYATTQILTTR